MLYCDRLTVVEMLNPAGKGRTMGLEAEGNGLVEGQKFTAGAERITYDENKGLLTLQGNGYTDAWLNLQQRVGRGGEEIRRQDDSILARDQAVQGGHSDAADGLGLGSGL